MTRLSQDETDKILANSKIERGFAQEIRARIAEEPEAIISALVRRSTSNASVLPGEISRTLNISGVTTDISNFPAILSQDDVLYISK